MNTLHLLHFQILFDPPERFNSPKSKTQKPDQGIDQLDTLSENEKKFSELKTRIGKFGGLISFDTKVSTRYNTTEFNTLKATNNAIIMYQPRHSTTIRPGEVTNLGWLVVTIDPTRKNQISVYNIEESVLGKFETKTYDKDGNYTKPSDKEEDAMNIQAKKIIQTAKVNIGERIDLSEEDLGEILASIEVMVKEKVKLSQRKALAELTADIRK